MNKLQKLFDSGIHFLIMSHYGISKLAGSEVEDSIGWILFNLENTKVITRGFNKNFEEVGHIMWDFAREHYPDAECFKEESNG